MKYAIEVIEHSLDGTHLHTGWISSDEEMGWVDTMEESQFFLGDIESVIGHIVDYVDPICCKHSSFRIVPHVRRCTECKRRMSDDECGDVMDEELVCDTCAGIESEQDKESETRRSMMRLMAAEADNAWAEYKPYTGGAGPTTEQAEANTTALAKAVGAKLDRWGCGTLMAIKNGRAVTYDRWGFCADDDNSELDQADWDTAVDYMNTHSSS